MPSATSVVLALIIIFLILKFLGLAKQFLGIDPFGLEIDLVWGLVAAGFGILYRETRELRKTVDSQFDKLSTRLSSQGERIAKLEGKAENVA